MSAPSDADLVAAFDAISPLVEPDAKEAMRIIAERFGVTLDRVRDAVLADQFNLGAG